MAQSLFNDAATLNDQVKAVFACPLRSVPQKIADLEQLATAEVRPPDVPLDPAVRYGLADPEPSPDLEGLALHADRLRAEALASRLNLEQVDTDAVLSQASGQRQADRTGTDDRDVRHRRA